MWRTIAIALVLLAGCSAQSDYRAEQTTSTTRQTTETTTLTREDVQTSEERFVTQIQRRLDYDDPTLEDDALGIATHMCDALNVIFSTNAPDTDETELAAAGLDIGMDTGLDDEVTAIIYVIGAEQICPDHAGFVADYLEARGLPHT